MMWLRQLVKAGLAMKRWLLQRYEIFHQIIYFPAMLAIVGYLCIHFFPKKNASSKLIWPIFLFFSLTGRGDREARIIFKWHQ
jgi:hypothetical protein